MLENDAPTRPKGLEKAENDLWAWYLEWSQIARIAVTQRVLLHQLGFLSTHKSKADEDQPADLDPALGVTARSAAVSPHA